MKISQYHKAQGDHVEWYDSQKEYDTIYSSKIFSYTPDEKLPPNTIKGGTGYDVNVTLPPEIEKCVPDYSIYPKCDFALGFMTRGCPNKCKWCVVPEKEGKIRFVNTIEQIARKNVEKIVFMDNNALASDKATEELRKLAKHTYDMKKIGISNVPRIDFNQGLDASLVTYDIAEILSKISWIDHIRFACDSMAKIESVKNTIRLLNKYGVPTHRVFLYFLVEDIEDAMERIKSLREHKGLFLYAQAYRNINDNKVCSKEALDFANRYVYQLAWKVEDWYNTTWGMKYLGK
jgi:hypothetical protein